MIRHSLACRQTKFRGIRRISEDFREISRRDETLRERCSDGTLTKVSEAEMEFVNHLTSNDSFSLVNINTNLGVMK